MSARTAPADFLYFRIRTIRPVTAKGIVNRYIVPKFSTSFQGRSFFCSSVVFASDFMFAISCSPMLSEKNRISLERTLSGKYGIVKNGVSIVSSFRKFIIIVSMNGHDTSRYTPAHISASMIFIFFVTARYTHAAIRNNGIVYIDIP